MKYRLLAIAVTISTVALVPVDHARGDSLNFLTVTETGGPDVPPGGPGFDFEQLTFSLTIQGHSYFSNATFSVEESGGPAAYLQTGEIGQGIFLQDGLCCGDPTNYIPFVNWIDPEDPGLYNTLEIVGSGNRLTTSFNMAINYSSTNMGNGNSQCYSYTNPPPVIYNPCPVLANGQSLEVSTSVSTALDPGVNQFISLTETFTEIPASTPEPACISLCAAGLLGVGWARRRRCRSRPS